MYIYTLVFYIIMYIDTLFILQKIVALLFYENVTSWMVREISYKSDKILFKQNTCINMFIYQMNI